MNNLSSYCGLVDAKIRATDKDLHVQSEIIAPNFSNCRKITHAQQLDIQQEFGLEVFILCKSFL